MEEVKPAIRIITLMTLTHIVLHIYSELVNIFSGDPLELPQGTIGGWQTPV